MSVDRTNHEDGTVSVRMDHEHNLALACALSHYQVWLGEQWRQAIQVGEAFLPHTTPALNLRGLYELRCEIERLYIAVSGGEKGTYPYRDIYGYGEEGYQAAMRSTEG